MYSERREDPRPGHQGAECAGAAGERCKQHGTEGYSSEMCPVYTIKRATIESRATIERSAHIVPGSACPNMSLFYVGVYVIVFNVKWPVHILLTFSCILVIKLEQLCLYDE